MILIMGGYPLSGKSEFCIKLKKAVPLSIHINPKDYLPEGFENLDGRMRSVWMTSAWELAYEKTTEFIKRTPNKALAIFDTSAAKYQVLKPLIDFAEEKGHGMIYVFIHASEKDRSARTKLWDDVFSKLEAKYTLDFKHTIPALKSRSDKFYVVKNSNGESGYRAIDDVAESIAQYIKSVRENQHGPDD